MKSKTIHSDFDTVLVYQKVEYNKLILLQDNELRKLTNALHYALNIRVI